MMESVIYEQLKTSFPTPVQQQAQLKKLVGEFGTLRENDVKFVIGDILCLAKILFEGGDDEVVRNMQRQILDLESAHKNERQYLQKLDYLKKCLTNFKPAIYRNIQEYFSRVFSINPSLITCLPKTTGQQIGAKVEIKHAPDDTNPMVFYVKSHQEFCSKSHSQYIAITSDGTGQVDFKELFMYKVLEYLGYGAKTQFIVDKDVSQSRVDEGILIATQDLGFTKHPERKSKKFTTFKDMGAELSSTPITSIDAANRRDIIAIDMLSRAFLLEDVMINQGNFGKIISTIFGSSPQSSSKWKVVDFISPKLGTRRGDDYSYSKHYPGGMNIFYSFKVGNVSHTYDQEGLEIIASILSEEHAKGLWFPVAERLCNDTPRHLSVVHAVERAFDDIARFMGENQVSLQMKPERFTRRMEDLNRYKTALLRNFDELVRGIREYTIQAPTSTSTPTQTPL